MFNTTINRIDAFPRSLMQKVCAPYPPQLDDSLYMTAIILLHNRVENLKFNCSVHYPDTDNTINLNPEEFSIEFFESRNHNPDEYLKRYKGKIDKLPTHEKFLSEQLKQPIFIRILPDDNTVCIFTNKVTLPMWHCISFLLPKFFSVFKDKPLTKDETSFLETLTYKTGSNYVTKLTELADKDSFRTYVLKDQLHAFEKNLFENKVNAARGNLNNLEIEMEKAMEAYRKACEKRLDALALVNGLQTMCDNVQEHTELQDYLINNPRLTCVSIDGTKMSFIVKTILSPHHIDEWEVMSKRKQMFSLYATTEYSADDIKIILDSILSENRCLRLKMCAYFVLDYFGSSATSQTNYNYVAVNKDLENYIPNPHLQHHNCFGQNKTAILDQLVSGDAVGAIECAIACAQRINIHDMSFNAFIPDLLRSTGKCMVTEDGTEMTVKQALTYLKGRK